MVARTKGLTANSFATEMLLGAQEQDPYFLTVRVGRRKIKLTCPNFGIMCWYSQHGDYHTRGGTPEAIAEFMYHMGSLNMAPQRFKAATDYLRTAISRETGELFRQIIAVRESHGMFDAFDPVSALEIMCEANPASREVLMAAGFAFEVKFPEYPDFEDVATLTSIMDYVLRHPQLRDLYVSQAELYVQNASGCDYEWIGRTVQQILPADSLIVDVGAGSCKNIMKVASIVRTHQFVAIERQALGSIFPNGSCPRNLQMVNADYLAAHDLEPCDAMIFAAVWGHQTLKRAKLIAAKALTQLKDGSYVFSSPQLSGEFGNMANVAVHQKHGDRLVAITDYKFGA